jgi:hypothetical protein
LKQVLENTDRFSGEVGRLVNQVSHWTPSRWAASGASGTRADLVFELVQELADRAADAESEPRRVVPRLPHDSALVDQVRLLAADLVAAAPGAAVLEAAAERVVETRRSLSSPGPKA